MAKTKEQIIQDIESGATTLGIEYGSTRIKAVLDDADNNPIAIGTFDWENTFDGTYWTYAEEELVSGIQAAYASLKADVAEKYGVTLTKVGAMGISAMMHGYLPLDAAGNLLVPFRTWRNTTTTRAASELSELFKFHIPERWSVSHIYQAVLDGEAHVPSIDFFTTLAGYAHWKLTDPSVLTPAVEKPVMSDGHVTVQVTCNVEGAWVWCAVYGQDGRMLGVQQQPAEVGENVDYTFSFGEEAAAADQARVFLLNADGSPLCESGKT